MKLIVFISMVLVSITLGQNEASVDSIETQDSTITQDSTEQDSTVSSKDSTNLVEDSLTSVEDSLAEVATQEAIDSVVTESNEVEVASSPKDTIVFKKGERIMGKVLEYHRDVITFETDYSDDDFTIETDLVQYVNTNSIITVTDDKGVKYSGQLTAVTGTGTQVATEDGVKTIPVGNLVEVEEKELTFIDKLDASIDMGYLYKRSKHESQFNGQAKIAYNAETWRLAFLYNGTTTKRDLLDTNDAIIGDDKTNRQEIDLGFTVDLARLWFAEAGLNFLSNTEQKIDIRYTEKLGLGKYFIKNTTMFWSLSAGIAGIQDHYSSVDPNEADAAVYIATELVVDGIDDFSFSIRAQVLPVISGGGGLTSNGATDIKFDLPLDFYVRAGFLIDYTTDPVAGALDTDYQVSFGFGWEL